MINRKIDSILKKHFENSRNALLLTGARQIGKTSSIRAFGRAAFKNFVEINFIESPDAAAIFIGASNAQVPLEKNKTLVFLDEIQACPEAITAIKFLVEEGYFRYILSGSLLGVELKDVRSIPVGFFDRSANVSS